jgi:RNA polymerase sigma-70 factor (ECF subfamily)
MDESDRADTIWRDRLEAGGDHGLAEAFEHFRPRLRRMVDLRMDARLAGRVDASDVIQETYLDAARQLRLYLARPEVSVFVWLRRLAWERMLSTSRRHLEAQKRDVHRELNLPDESSVLLARSLLDGGSPSGELVLEELRDEVRRAVARLPETDREAILLRHFEGLTNKEIAEALGLTAPAATMRYGRALLRLKGILTAGPGAAPGGREGRP